MKSSLIKLLVIGFFYALLDASPAHAQVIVDELTVGDLTISHAKVVYKSDHLDLFFSIKNKSKIDEKLSGADTALMNENIVEITKDKNGKDEEVQVQEILAADKTTDFEKDGKYLRIKGVKEPRETDILPISLMFRRSPNANLKLALNPSKAEKTPTAISVPVGASVTPAPPPPPQTTANKPNLPNLPNLPRPLPPPPLAPAAPTAKSSSFLDWFKK